MLEDGHIPHFHWTGECADCGETDPTALELDHPEDVAEFPSEEMVLRDWREPAEISDFQVVCSSCHLSRARSRGLVGEVFRCWRNTSPG